MNQKNLTKVDVYNEDYIKLNNAYITMYDTCQRLSECKDADPNVVRVLQQILFAFDHTLDQIKSEMTVKTHFKDEDDVVATTMGESGGKIFHPKFD